MRPRIGVLSLQGCVQPHRPHIENHGGSFVEVKTPQDLEQIDALILPGGESTTMLKLIDIFSMEESLRSAFSRIPIWGICAGAILMAKKVEAPEQKSFGLLDITVERNSYGRQIDSFNTTVQGYPVSFIRAPRIRAVGNEVKILAELDGAPIWVQSGRFMATTFHAELTRPQSDVKSPTLHAFLEMIERA